MSGILTCTYKEGWNIINIITERKKVITLDKGMAIF